MLAKIVTNDGKVVEMECSEVKLVNEPTVVEWLQISVNEFGFDILGGWYMNLHPLASNHIVIEMEREGPDEP